MWAGGVIRGRTALWGRQLWLDHDLMAAMHVAMIGCFEECVDAAPRPLRTRG